MEYILLMTFVTSTGEKQSLSVTGVKSDLTSVEVSSLMDTITSQNIFATKKGSFVEKHSAQITERKITKLVVA